MMLAVACLFASVVVAVKATDPDVCTEPITTCGPIAPSPPHSYVALLEEVDIEDYRTTYTKEYYDPAQNILALTKDTRYGTQHAIFYYQTNVAVVMDYLRGVEDGEPKVRCSVGEIVDQGLPWLAGYHVNGTFVTIPAPSQALFFGGDYKYEYMANWPNRGIPCNKWRTCVDTVGNGTLSIHYYWSDPFQFFDMYGFARERPVMAEMVGYYYPPWGGVDKVNANTQVNFGLFDGKPNWSQHQWALEIPSEVYCPDLPKGKRPPTKIIKEYSLRVEVVLHTSAIKGQEIVNTVKAWYDLDRKLTRMDMIPTNNTAEWLAAGFNEVTAIKDYRAGVEYIIDKTLGNCSAIALHDNRYNTITDGHVSFTDPLELLTSTIHVDKLIYYGKKAARGFPCDVWVGRLDITIGNVTFQDQLTYEYYFLEEGWREDSGTVPEGEEDDPTPILIKIQQDVTSPSTPFDEFRVALEENIFKFDPSSTAGSFDITPCYFGHDQIRRFQMSFPYEFREDFDANPAMFTKTVHDTLAMWLYVPAIRVQHLEIEFSETDGRLYAEFTLVDQPPVQGVDFPPEVGPPLATVVQTLTDIMPTFMVILIDPSYDTPGHIKKMKPYPDSLEELFEDECHPLRSLKTERQDYLSFPKDSREKTKEKTSKKTKNKYGGTGIENKLPGSDSSLLSQSTLQTSFTQKMGEELDAFLLRGKTTRSSPMYTPGDMAGMGIGMLLLGVLLGTVGMLVLLRKFGLDHGMESIPMSSRRS